MTAYPRIKARVAVLIVRGRAASCFHEAPKASDVLSSGPDAIALDKAEMRGGTDVTGVAGVEIGVCEALSDGVGGEASLSLAASPRSERASSGVTTNVAAKGKLDLEEEVSSKLLPSQEPEALLECDMLNVDNGEDGVDGEEGTLVVIVRVMGRTDPAQAGCSRQLRPCTVRTTASSVCRQTPPHRNSSICSSSRLRDVCRQAASQHCCLIHIFRGLHRLNHSPTEALQALASQTWAACTSVSCELVTRCRSGTSSARRGLQRSMSV